MLSHTTTLSHPQVKLPARKELHFFLRRKAKQSIAVYLRQLPILADGQITGTEFAHLQI